MSYKILNKNACVTPTGDTFEREVLLDHFRVSCSISLFSECSRGELSHFTKIHGRVRAEFNSLRSDLWSSADLFQGGVNIQGLDLKLKDPLDYLYSVEIWRIRSTAPGNNSQWGLAGAKSSDEWCRWSVHEREWLARRIWKLCVKFRCWWHAWLKWKNFTWWMYIEIRISRYECTLFQI